MRKILLIGLIILIAASSFIAFSLYSKFYYNNFFGSQYSYPGMMGGMFNSQYSYYGQNVYMRQMIPINEAIYLMRNPPSYAHVFTSNDSIVFTSHEIDIVVLTMGHERAINLTGLTPPSYAQHDVFVIYGLINPTLIIPSGATVRVTVINLDKDMYHNFVITPLSPPYPYNVMMMSGGMMGGGMMGKFITMMPLLPPANYNQGYAYEFSYTFTLQPGSYWYICTYPGHAEMGMYGEILVG